MINTAERKWCAADNTPRHYWDPSPPRKWHYAFAVVSVLAIILLRFQVRVAFGDRPLLILFVFPIILSAYLGGLGPGLLATFVSAVTTMYFVMPPAYSFRIGETHDVFQWSVLIVNGVAISALIGWLHRLHARVDWSMRELRTSEAEQRQLLQNIATAVVVHAPDTRIIYSNPTASALLGLPADQLQGKPATDPCWPFQREDGQALLPADHPVNRVLTTLQPIHNCVMGLHQPGRTDATWLWVNAFPMFGPDCALQQVVMTFVDITALKRAESDVREKEAILRSFFDSRGVMRGIVEVTDDDILNVVNNNASATFFASTPAAMHNQFYSTLGVPTDIIKMWIAHYEACRESGQPVTFTYERARPDMTHYYSATVSFLDITPSGRPRYAFSVADITSAKQLQAQLAQAQKMESIGQLAGGVAHDFNNILQAINGFAELARSDLASEHPATPSVEEIAKAGTRAAKLVSQLLAFGRRQILEPVNLDLNAVVGSLAGMLERILGEHVRLDFIPGHQLGTVRADRNRIEQVVMNLCVNARDAMAQGGNLTLELENVALDGAYCRQNTWARPGRYVLLSVTDTGCGMDDATLSRIFDPFFTTKAQGSGLGLSMVYGIVRQHEGMVRAYSEPGKGTTFKVYLPAVERAVDAVGTKIEGPLAGGHETILVAEDDASLRDLACQTLQRAGYTVLLAADGNEALHLFRLHTQKINLLLLDVVMPDVGGREVFDRISAQHPHVPALFASGYSENAIHTNFVLQAGMTLLHKPYNTAELLRNVRAALDTAATRATR